MNYHEHTLPESLTVNFDESFHTLVLCYQDALYTFALRLSGSCQDAEDILQEALLGAYVTLSHYPPERLRALKLRAWLYKVTLNVFRNSKRGRQLETLPLDQSIEEAVSTTPGEDIRRPDLLFEDSERLQELLQLLDRLPEHYRIPVICYYFEDLSYLEIAQLLDQPVGTIKSRLHRGLQLLRHYLLGQGEHRSTSHAEIRQPS
jgi:RNA polymerase sigma-70 factor (ECF subfamily)